MVKVSVVKWEMGRGLPGQPQPRHCRPDPRAQRHRRRLRRRDRRRRRRGAGTRGMRVGGGSCGGGTPGGAAGPGGCAGQLGSAGGRCAQDGVSVLSDPPSVSPEGDVLLEENRAGGDGAQCTSTVRLAAARVGRPRRRVGRRHSARNQGAVWRWECGH